MPSKSPTKTQKKPLLIYWLVPLLLVVTAVVGIVIAYSANKNKAEASLPANVSAAEAAALFKDGAFLLDVRTQEEWNAGHIVGAVLIPLDQLAARMQEVPSDQKVLIICRSGNRSTEARNMLRAAGYANTTSVMGGINAWLSEGLPVVTGP